MVHQGLPHQGGRGAWIRSARRDAALAKGRIVVKGHPAIKANLSLSAAKSHARSAGDGADFYKAFERQGMEMLNFAGTRGRQREHAGADGHPECRSAEGRSAGNPGECAARRTDEGILPFVYDGQHVLLGGDPYKDEDGNTHISIDHLPDAGRPSAQPRRRR